MDALTLLAGDAQNFIEKVWASRVHVTTRSPDEYLGLLTLDDVDHLLTGSGLRTPALRLVRNGEVLPSSSYTRAATMAGQAVTGLVDARKALAAYDEGTTVVLQGLHRYWPPLTELVRSLELELGHPCQVNAYLTPPGAQGFARHRDTHDVFVVQTHGHKLWELVEDGVERELLFEPGMSVYLPAGTPHSARSQDVPSLHVTIGVNQVTWREVLQELSRSILDEERYDERLPAGYLADPQLFTERFTELAAAYAKSWCDVDTASMPEKRGHSFLTGRPSALAGGLVDRVRLDALDAGTPLRRRTTATCVLVGDRDRLRVLLGDRELRMPQRLEPAMSYIRDHDLLTPRDLPGLSERDALVLTRRLVLEGLLRIDA